MSNDSRERTLSRFLRAALIGLVGTVAGLGSPGLATAQTITCDGTPLIANPPQPSAQLGWSLSADGEWLAAGANQDAKVGSVSMYRNPGPATPQTDPKIIPGDLQSGDQFGSSVSISGNWMAVGAPGKTGGSGAVYLFQFDGSSWVQGAKLAAADAAQGAQFGFSVALSGTTLVVGAPGDSDRGSLAGAAYVFELQGGVWKQTAKLLAKDANGLNEGRPFDEFGSSVAIDGGEIVVGAPFADDLTVFKNFGAAYVFTRSPAGSWIPDDKDKNKGKLTAADTFRGDNIQFGSSVAIRGDRIVVGAPGDDQGPTDSGSAYVFEREGPNWVRQNQVLTAEIPRLGAQFGTAVVIADKNRVVIGARFDDLGGAKSGAAYRFEKQGGNWMRTKIIRHEPGGAFGQSVAVLGNQVFMGGYLAKVETADHAGAVAVCPSGVPTQQPHLTCKKSGPASVNAGEPATYAVEVTNDGTAAATGVILNDPTPAGLTFAGADKPCDKGFPCSLGTIAAGASLPPLKVTFRVSEGCSAPGSITNSATVTADGANTSTCRAPTTTVIRPIQQPQLSCTKQGPASAKPGDIITYNVTVNNSGCGAAKKVTLSDPTPGGLVFVGVSGPCTQLPCNLGTIRPGQTLPPVEVTFKVDVPLDCATPGPTVTNIATVDGKQCMASTRIVPPEANLVLTALVLGNAPVTCGTSFLFSLTASNLGPAVAKGAVIDVTAVGALSLTSSEPGCVPVAAGPQPHLLCTGLPDLPPGSPGHSITFSAQAPACGPGCGAVTINATVRSGNTCDRNPLNDTVTKVIPVTCLDFDLAITKRHEPGVLSPGQAMAYVLTVRNNGPSDLPGATVTDTLPNALLGPQCVGANASDCTFSGNNLTIRVGPLPARSEAVYRIEGQLAACTGTLSNTATVSPPPGFVDRDLSNNTATDTAVPFPPGVSIHCLGVSGAFEGDFVTFTYVLSNGGPNAQADNPGAEFTDTLPAGLTLVTATASSGTVTTAANTVSWNGSIPVCGTVTISVQATVDAGTAGMTLCNQGIVSFDADGNGTNESNASDSCCLKVIPALPVPTLSGASLAALALLLAGVALLRLRRRSL